MLLQRERELVAKYGRKMLEEGLTRGTSGNISIFNREKDSLLFHLLAFPTKMYKPKMSVLDLDVNRSTAT